MTTTQLHHPATRTVHDGRPAPRWATVCAHLVSAVVLPAGLWRIGLAVGFSMGMDEAQAAAGMDVAERVYIVSLSLFTEGLALLTLGLVRPWGERVPHWLPLIGGRRIPPRPVVAVAASGAVVLQLVWTFAFRHFPHFDNLDFTGPGWKALFLASYMPLLLWAPLLAAVTFAYWQRRCRD